MHLPRHSSDPGLSVWRAWKIPALVLLLAACGGSSSSEAPSAAEAPAAAAQQTTQDQLPAGHPPLATPPPSAGVVPPPPGSGTGATALTWTAPAGWVEEPPANAMRKAQYRIPGPGGEGECVVFYFGPGQGGDAMANATRWADQFSQSDGSSPRDAMKTEQIDVGGIPVLLVEVTGTYSGGMTMMGDAPQQLADHMLLGAVAEGADANWFFKLTGPASTIGPQRDAFRGMIRSLAPGA